MTKLLYKKMIPKLLCVALGMSAVVHNVSAALISYTDRTAWEAALGGAVINENFSSVTSDIYFGGISAVVGDLTFSSNASNLNSAQIRSSGYLYPSGLGNGEYIDVAFQRMFAGIGFDYNSLDATGDQLSVLISSQLVLTIPGGFGPLSFFGVIDDTGNNLSNLQFLNINQSSTYGSISTISWGAASVPEPSTFTIMALGLAGLGYSTKKNKKKSVVREKLLAA